MPAMPAGMPAMAGYGMPAGYGMAAPPPPPAMYTPPPTMSTMDYSSFMAGGYSSMACGYGYSKASDGSCQAMSWVSLFFKS